MGCVNSRPRPRGTVQSLFFPKAVYTRKDAITWANMNHFFVFGVDELHDGWRVRQCDPTGAPTRVEGLGNGVRAVIEERKK